MSAPTITPAADLGDVARRAMHACVHAIAYFEDNEPAEHGRRELGETWAAVTEAAMALRDALGLSRRFDVTSPDGTHWRIIDKADRSRVVASGHGAGEAFALADWCASIDRTPVEAHGPAVRLRCARCGGAALGVQWPDQDTGFSLCAPCGDRARDKHESPAELARLYGVRGIHWDSRR